MGRRPSNHLDPLLRRLVAGPVAPEELTDPLERGLALEALGELALARDTYDEAADDGDLRADWQLFALEANAGHPDARLRLLPALTDDDPDGPELVHACNRALYEWRAGRAAVARSLLLEVDAAGRSGLGRALEACMEVGTPPSRLRFVSPLLAHARRFAVGRALERAAALEPHNPDAVLALARFEVSVDHTAAARVALTALAGRYPGWSEPVQLLAALGASA